MEQVATLIQLGNIELGADISIPERARGLVLFAHGSGSSRRSPRNHHVAQVLNRGAIATLLTDLLTEQEEAEDIRTAHLRHPAQVAKELRFDIPLLGGRVAAIAGWIGGHPVLKKLGLGYFGASTGAAAALVAAAERPNIVRAVVSRGGRPDLAGAALQRVFAPTLFIVGGEDRLVLALNRSAMSQLPRQGEHRLEIIPGATHLFEEPGALDTVAALARDWFWDRLP
jgi:putative phosphoribosyl transferase